MITKEEKGAVVVGRSQSDRTEMRPRDEPRVSDASSQTTPTPSPPPTPPRRQFQEEIECDQLSRDLASQLSPSHKLHGILGTYMSPTYFRGEISTLMLSWGSDRVYQPFMFLIYSLINVSYRSTLCLNSLCYV